MCKIAFISIMWHSRFVEELGVEYLTSVLRTKSKNDVKILIKFPEDDYDCFWEKVLDYEPDLIGVSLSHKYTGLEPIYAAERLGIFNMSKPFIFVGGIFASTNADNKTAPLGQKPRGD